MNITNFRDIGGYETDEGRRVKKGFFYRSAPIVFREEADRAEFEALGMRTILDLRSAQERAAQPDDTVEGCRYIPCGALSEEVMSGNFDMAALLRGGDLSLLAKYVEESYRAMPFGNPAYQTLFDLLRRQEVPVVFHCSAGKDRTGFAACLILKILGVCDKTVMEDYLLSNVYRREENERILAAYPNAAGAEGLMYVKESYLRSSLDAIAAKYDSFESYLLAEYGVTAREIAEFKARYTE